APPGGRGRGGGPNGGSSAADAPGDDHVAAAVLRPAALLALGADRPLLAVGERAQARVRDAERGEVVLDRVGAALAERQVELVRAALVGVAFDQELKLRRALEQVGVARQAVAGFVGQRA